MNELQRRIFSQGAQDLRAVQGDRRREPRTQIARPVYLRHIGPSDAPLEEVRTMTDFSRIGFYFITPRIESYHKGMQLYTIPALGCFNFEYISEVVRIEPLRYGEHGIAVELIRIGNPVLYTSPIAPPESRSSAWGKNNILPGYSDGSPRI
jgi:hypothetical protein